MLEVTSSAFEPGGKIPEKYTREGGDVSPPLAWSGAPEETKCFVVICDDPDAPMDEPFVHWVVYGIPGDRQGLPEGSVAGGVEGQNSFGRVGYGGPMPPKGHGVHHYHFRVYAANCPVDYQPGVSKHEVLSGLEGRVLDQGELIGTYER